VDRAVAESGDKLDAGVVQTGFICYTDEPRMMVIIRRLEAGRQEIISYAGTWSIEDDTVCHQVEMSSRESWIDTKQIRHFAFEGNRLTLTPPISKDPTHGIVTRRSLTWERLVA
jgi:hypothetical protein